MEIGQSAGKNFAYLLGVYLGDGCVTFVQKSYRFRLNTIDKDFAEAVSDALLALTGKSAIVNGPYQDKRFPKSAPQYQLCSCNQRICNALMVQTDSKRMIPAWIFDASKEDRLAFIAGLMDSEGYVAEQRDKITNRRYFMGFKSCDPWVRDFARLMEITGIRLNSIRDEKPRKLHYKTPTVFTIKMQSWIDAGGYFRCTRKQKRVDAWGEFGAYEQRAIGPRKAKIPLNEHTQSAPSGVMMCSELA